MREILFKGKKIDGGEWVEGYVVRRYGTWFIYDINNSDTCRQNNYMVEEDTICQYTGFATKCGTKIWENDIVQIGWYKGIVKYEDGCFIIKWSNIKWVRKDIVYWISLDDFVVIGNIFDNPELFEIN